jgi:hypothetical protein
MLWNEDFAPSPRSRTRTVSLGSAGFGPFALIWKRGTSTRRSDRGSPLLPPRCGTFVARRPNDPLRGWARHVGIAATPPGPYGLPLYGRGPPYPGRPPARPLASRRMMGGRLLANHSGWTRDVLSVTAGGTPTKPGQRPHLAWPKTGATGCRVECGRDQPATCWLIWARNRL